MDFWARAFAFDALISNTDRHADNWAVITGENKSRMSPLYDNGSSLGCGLDVVGLDRAFDDAGTIVPGHIEKMRRNGRHHVRIDSPGRQGSRFEGLCGAFLSIYPEGRQWFEEAGTVPLGKVRELMTSISAETTCLPDLYRLSKRRRTHIYAMLTIGKERIKNILDMDRFDD